MGVLGTWDISFLDVSMSLPVEPSFPWMLEQIGVEVQGKSLGPSLSLGDGFPRPRGKQRRLTCLAAELWLVCSVPVVTGQT